MYNGVMEEIYLTETSEINERHRSRYIVRFVSQNYYLAEFDTREQLSAWCKLMGVSMMELPKNTAMFPDTVKVYELSKSVQQFSFGDLSQIPQGAIKHKGMSNGSIVDCYLYVTPIAFGIFRPNPNFKNVYVPLPLEEHMQYIRDKKKFLI